MKTAKTYAFEGINASGKSSVIKAVAKTYENVHISKVGGLGDTPRMQKLKEILSYRENLRKENKLTPKQQNDFNKDKIFRLAIKEQLRNWQDKPKAEIYFLDRTPMMSWAYSASVDIDNPYLSEILEEGLELTGKLNIDKLFHFDITPTTAYTRIVCRSVGENYTVKDLVDLIHAPEPIKEEVLKKSYEIIESNSQIDKKTFRIWDFMSYDEIERQTQTYKEAANLVQEKLGVDMVTIDANKSLEEVIQNVQREL